MKNGKCPKCGSTNVRKGRTPGMWTSDKAMIPLGGGLDGHLKTRHYLCIRCGYVETYVTDPKGLEKARTKWKLATDGD